MILRFATKRNASGNRKYLAIDTTERVFARDNYHWYSKEDLTAEVTTAQRNKLIEQLKDADFFEIDRL